MNLRETVVDIGAKAMNAGHRLLHRASGGRLLKEPFGMPAYRLHTTGRKSGQRRTTILTAPIVDRGGNEGGDRIVFVASKGGDPRDPDWYRNLVANPDVEVGPLDGGPARPMRARTASTEEKAELWPRIVSAYKGYAGYQKRTRRDIPVVVCEPRES